MLYSAGKYFVCRNCAGLMYDSQRGSVIERWITAKHKLGSRIFENYDGDDWGCHRKKGMHYSTFSPLLDKYRALAAQIDAALVSSLASGRG